MRRSLYVSSEKHNYFFIIFSLNNSGRKIELLTIFLNKNHEINKGINLIKKAKQKGG